MDAVLSSNVQDDSMKQILEAVDERLLMQALENEFRVAIRLICVRPVLSSAPAKQEL